MDLKTNGASGNGAKDNGVSKDGSLLSVVESLVSSINLDDYLKKITQSAEELLESEASTVMLLSDDKKTLTCKFVSGTSADALKKMTLPVSSGIMGWVALNGKPEMVADVRTDKRFAASFDQMSGFVTRSLICVPIMFRGESVGVLEVLNRRGGPYSKEHMDILSGLANLASAAIANTRAIQEQQSFFSHILELLGSTVEIVKPNMHGHSTRCAGLACAIGKAIELDEHQYRMLYYAAYLHDIGYVGLGNPHMAAQLGLTPGNEEHHPLASIKMLEGIKVLSGALPIIEHHHEAFDGTGFPGHLKGDQIPVGARILSLVESLEELRSTSGMAGDDLIAHAVRHLKAGSGTSFDPQLASTAVEILENYKGVW